MSEGLLLDSPSAYSVLFFICQALSVLSLSVSRVSAVGILL